MASPWLRAAGQVEHQAEAVVLRRVRGAAVLRQRQPAGIDQQPARPPADHAGQHRQRDLSRGRGCRSPPGTGHRTCRRRRAPRSRRRDAARAARSANCPSRRSARDARPRAGVRRRAPRRRAPPRRSAPCRPRCGRHRNGRRASSRRRGKGPSRAAISSSRSSSGRNAAAAFAAIDLDQRAWRLPVCAAIAPAVSRSSVSTMTAAPALFSFAT